MKQRKTSEKGKKVGSLRAKSLTGKQAKGVKGGVIAIISSARPTESLLPYIEQSPASYVEQKPGKR